MYRPSKYTQIISTSWFLWFFNGCFQVDDSKSLHFFLGIIEHPENYWLRRVPELSETSCFCCCCVSMFRSSRCWSVCFYLPPSRQLDSCWNKKGIERSASPYFFVKRIIPMDATLNIFVSKSETCIKMWNPNIQHTSTYHIMRLCLKVFKGISIRKRPTSFSSSKTLPSVCGGWSRTVYSFNLEKWFGILHSCKVVSCWS